MADWGALPGVIASGDGFVGSAIRNSEPILDLAEEFFPSAAPLLRRARDYWSGNQLPREIYPGQLDTVADQYHNYYRNLKGLSNRESIPRYYQSVNSQYSRASSAQNIQPTRSRARRPWRRRRNAYPTWTKKKTAFRWKAISKVRKARRYPTKRRYATARTTRR